jgi:hypothetical protein
LIALCLIRFRSVRSTLLLIFAWSFVWILLVETLGNNASLIDGWAITRYGTVAALGPTLGQDSFYRWLVYFSPYIRVGEFVLGCCVANLYVRLRDRPPSHRERVVGLFSLAIGIMSLPLVFYFTYSKTHSVLFLQNLSLNYGLAPSVALLIFGVARYRTWLQRLLCRPTLVGLGDASYSIYLIHFPIFWAVSSYLGDALPLSWPAVTFAMARFIFVLFLILLLSVGLNRYVEVPARRWLRSLWAQRRTSIVRPVGVGIAASPIVAALLIAMIEKGYVAAGTDLANGIQIYSATYGKNCGAPIGNATRLVSRTCSGRVECSYTVQNAILGDPAPGCAKAFEAEYACGPGSQRLTGELPAEAGLGSVLELACTSKVASNDPAATAATNPEPVAATGVQILSATYGGSCGAPRGNATKDLANRCNGREDCDYVVDVDRLGDPAPRCGKDFQVEYSCAPDTALLLKQLPAEAGLKGHLQVNCTPETKQAVTPTPTINPLPATSDPVVETGLNIRTATYGGNCGAVSGNATRDLAGSCNGLTDCNYVVDVERLRDPAPQCGKDFQVEYSCAPETALKRKELPAEAGLKSQLRLSCAPETEYAEVPTPIVNPVPPVPKPVVESGLNIRSATYGGNCGAPSGNAANDLASRCNGRAECNYIVDVDRLRDPAPGCSKDFQVEYSCAPDSELLRKELPGEAGLRSRLQLSCVQNGTQ